MDGCMHGMHAWMVVERNHEKRKRKHFRMHGCTMAGFESIRSDSIRFFDITTPNIRMK